MTLVEAFVAEFRRLQVSLRKQIALMEEGLMRIEAKGRRPVDHNHFPSFSQRRANIGCDRAIIVAGRKAKRQARAENVRRKAMSQL